MEPLPPGSRRPDVRDDLYDLAVAHIERAAAALGIGEPSTGVAIKHQISAN